MTELVVKANALARAAYTLTVAEHKMILSAITQVRRDEAVTDEVMYSISANALADMGGFAAKMNTGASRPLLIGFSLDTSLFRKNPMAAGGGFAKCAGYKPLIILMMKGALKSGSARMFCRTSTSYQLNFLSTS